MSDRNDRKVTGTEDTVIAGISSDPSLRTSSVDSIRLPASLLIAGRYELVGLVGVGGMGSVYHARDTELDEDIALKVLRRELVDAPGMLERFRREVKLARRVTHKNVARTFDIGEHGGERFLTMEFIEGESLGRLLEREGTLGIARSIEIVSAVCAGLGAAHAANVVHRDLKPDNVLIATDGRIVITDFGVARGGFEANPLQTLGLPVGTPAYMSPEQVEGAPDIDARTDIYSLGAILYELMAGEIAWGGPSPYAVAAARLTAPPPDPRRKRLDVPDALAEVTLKCMARERGHRFASAEDLAAALAEIAAQFDPTTGRTRVPRRPSSSPPMRENEKLVAVLPFANRGEPEDEYLADAITEDLIDALASTKGLRVTPLGTVMALKSADGDSRDLGRGLEVQVVVEGTLRRTDGVVRISSRLVSVADGFQLWTRRFERNVTDLVIVADEAANAIAESLLVRRASPAREAPADAKALDLYLRARHEYHQGWALSTQRAVALFEEALKRQPNDPRILSGYALAQMRRLGNEETSEGAAHVALRAAERARAVAPNAGEPLVALAAYHLVMGDYRAAAREVNDALRRAPSLPDVHDLCGRILVEVGRPEEGIAFLERALLLEPRIGRARGDIARVSALLGDWSQVEPLYSTTPKDEAEQNGVWFLRARIALWRRDVEWAARALGEMPASLGLRAPIEGLCGIITTGVIPESLTTLVDSLGKVTGRVRRRPIFYRQLKAEALAYVGHEGGALATIEDAATLGLIDVVWLDHCPLFKAMRGSRRFAEARQQVAERASLVLEAFT
ncbi:MAG: protein kinase domain-containing protein [Polyangiaceae bacterium]|jgi:eukaryotic-like serine/threonine-protein kinase